MDRSVRESHRDGGIGSARQHSDNTLDDSKSTIKTSRSRVLADNDTVLNLCPAIRYSALESCGKALYFVTAAFRHSVLLH